MNFQLQKIIKCLNANITRTYLILANIVLVIFAIWFSNVGVLPFKNLGDFGFFLFLAIILAIYRPGWTFVLFVGSIALENINLAPDVLGLAVRPYQFFGAITIFALFVQIATKRLPFSLPKFRWYDALPVIFVLSGFLSAVFSVDRGMSFKQSLVAFSFVALYFLVRVYVQSFEDLKKVTPFFLSSAVVVATWGILQNILFLQGSNSFEVMPGRPNSTFTEPDWLGMYLVFVLAAIYVLIYRIFESSNNKPVKIFNFKFLILNQFQNFSIFKQTLLYLGLISIFISLILTVSRSAWVGAAFVLIGFLKIMLTNGSLRLSDWSWRNFFHAIQILAVALICSIGIIYIFGLTRFQLFNRAASTGGLQKITIACPAYSDCPVSQKIGNLSELASCNCRHINLEDIEKEKAAGNKIQEVYRPDPNVNIRAEIYRESITQITTHPVLGIGWRRIGKILGPDERGASLNASNIFLEVWLGAGIIGFLSLVILLGYIFIKSAIIFLDRKVEDKTIALFVMLGLTAVIIPNLFNSGIFLGFFWVYVAIAISLLQTESKIDA